MEKFNEKEGVWRTIRGRRVFIRKGESLDSAMKRSGKFDNRKSDTRDNKPFKNSKDKVGDNENKEKNQETPDRVRSTRKEVKDKIREHIRNYYENDEDLVRDMDAGADPRKDFTSWAKGERLVEGGSFLIANADMADELNSWGINPQNKQYSLDKSYNTYKSLMGREMGKIYDEHKEYQLYKQAKENPDSISPMTENSTDWGKLDRKYSKRYHDETIDKIDKMDSLDERKEAISKYVKNTGTSRDLINDQLAEKEYDRHLQKEYESRYGERLNKISSNNGTTSSKDINSLQNYEVYDLGMSLQNETKDYELKSKINKQLDRIDRANKRGSGYSDKATNDLRNTIKEYEEYKQSQIYPEDYEKFGKSQSEWRELDKKYSERYNEERKNNYTTKYSDKNQRHEMTYNNRAYDDTNYAWARTEDYDVEGDWTVKNPLTGKEEVVKGQQATRSRLNEINTEIQSGVMSRNSEGVSKYQPIRNKLDAYNKYKQEHPNTKMTYNEYKNNIAFETQEDRMRNAGVEFATSEQTSSLQSKANNVVDNFKKQKQSNTNKIPRDFEKGYGKFKVETNSNKGHLDDRYEITKDERGYHAKNLRTGETYATFADHLRNKDVFEFEKPKTDTQTKIDQRLAKIRSNNGLNGKSSVSTITEKEVRGIKTQKALKGLIESGKATDITSFSDEQTRALREKHGSLEKVKVTKGTYGMNGALLKSYKTGEHFVITSRNGNLFYWV